MLLWILLIIVSSIWINLACGPFEESSDYLGRNLGHGIKGATINAIGSSLPELFVTVLCLFVFKDTAGFASGIATSAGSAVFNAAIIPAVVLLAIVFKLKISSVSIKKRVMTRDGIFYILSIALFIYIMLQPSLTWWMGGMLIALYALYAFVLIQWQRMFGGEEEEEEEEHEHYHEASGNRFLAFIKFDYKTLFCGSKPFNDLTAWFAIILATLQIGAACFVLTHAIIEIAEIWHMNTFFVAVILAAAATSIPDTIISLKDAMKGNYEDAMANAIGSNIFDICIGLGLPVIIYTLINGSLQIAPENAQGVLDLIVILLVITFFVMALFLIPKKVGLKTSIILLMIYAGYAVFAISSGLKVGWAMRVSEFIRGIL